MVKVFGYHGHNNAGDEAFKLVFDRVFAGHRVEYATPAGGPPEADRPLVVGGGAVLNDYFLKPLRHVEAVHVVGCSLPYGEADAARTAAALGGRLRTLLVRSRADVAALRHAGLPAEFVPDLVFSLDRAAPAGPVPQAELEGWTALPPRRWGHRARTAVVCLSDDYSVLWSSGKPELFARVEAFKDELARALDEIAGKFNLLFLPFSVWHSARDYLFAHDVVRRMRRRDEALVVERALSPERLMDAIAGTGGIVLSMKYHGLVFGLGAGKLCINIGSTRKNRDLMADAGLDGLSFPYERLTAARLLGAVEKHREVRLLDQIARLRDDWRAEASARLREFARAYIAEAAAGAAPRPAAALAAAE